MGRLALRAGWGSHDLEFVHVNELAGRRRDRGAPADASTPSTAAGTARRAATATRSPSTAAESRYSDAADARRGAPGTSSASRSCSSARAGSGRSSRSRRTSSGACGRSIVAAPVKDDRALNIVIGVNDDRYDPARARRRHRGVVHDELPGAGGQGAPRGHRHRARLDHDAARHDEHADARRRAAQGPAPRARRGAVADPDDDRVGDGDRADLPRAPGQARRPRGPRAAAQRVADRLRLRGRAPDDGRGGQRAAARPRPTGRWPGSSATRSGRSSRSTTRTTRARASSTRCRRWSSTGPRSRSSPGTTTSGATRTAWSSSPRTSPRSPG